MSRVTREDLESKLHDLANALGLSVGHGANNLHIDGASRMYRIEQVCADGQGVRHPFGPERRRVGELMEVMEFAISAVELGKKAGEPPADFITITVDEEAETKSDMADALRRIAGLIDEGYTSGYSPMWELHGEEGEDNEEAVEGCYYHDPDTCEGELWECMTCHEEFCEAHSHSTDKGDNVECVACERERKDKEDKE